MKSVLIRSYFWSAFPVFGPEITPSLDTFHAVYVLQWFDKFDNAILSIKAVNLSEQTFTCLKSTTETPSKHDVRYVQS